MRFAKIAITAATLVGIGVPAGLAISIAADPRPVSASDRFLLKFDDQSDPDGSKRAYQTWLQNQLNEVFAAYKKEHPDSKGLQLNYITLGNQPPIDYFNNVNRSLQALNKDLSFKLILRSPTSLGDGYNRRNADMINFFWGPDYNGVGTWLQYMFTDSYGLPNMWQPLSQIINGLQANGDVVINNNVVYSDKELRNNADDENWVLNLAKHLTNFKVEYSDADRDAQGNIIYTTNSKGKKVPQNLVDKTLPIVSFNSSTNKYHATTNEEATQIVSKYLYLDTGTFYQAIANGVASWADGNDHIEGNLTDYEHLSATQKDKAYVLPDIYNDNQNGGFQGNSYKPSKSVQLVNWLNSYAPIMPYYQAGPFTIGTSLLRYGAHTPTQEASGGQDFMDWWYNDNYKKPGTPRGNSGQNWTTEDQKEYNGWWQVNPFETRQLPYNQTFTQTPNAYYSSQNISTFFRWMMTGDFDTVNPDASAWGNELTNCLSVLSVDDFARFIDNGWSNTNTDPKLNTTTHVDGKANSDGSGYIDVPIRSVQWVDAKGKPVNYYVSPQDMWAGLKGYVLASQLGFAQNAYFLDMLKLDTEKTLNDPINQERNNKGESKVFRLYFDKPDLAGRTIADILSSQFFAAMPAFSQLVQNYTDDSLFKQNVATTPTGELDVSNTKFDNLYGGGNPFESYKHLYYCSPYIVSKANEQEIDYQLNKTFYDKFEEDGTANDGHHLTFQLNPKMLKTKEVGHRFEKLNIRYAGSFNPRITYEEFKKGTIDTTSLTQADRVEALEGAGELVGLKTPAEKEAVFKRHPLLRNLWNQPTTKTVQSDLIPYNPSVYVNNANGSIALIKDGSPKETPVEQNDPIYQKVATDAWGNTIFPAGYHPSVKNKVSPGYEELIVRNMSTPIDARDKNGNLLPPLQRSSAIIRTAINNLINWYSLIFTVNPLMTFAIQNSTIPYGDFKTNPKDTDLRFTYWSLSSYKVSNDEQNQINEAKSKQLSGDIKNGLGYRQGGLIQWTLPELVDQWKQLFNTKK